MRQAQVKGKTHQGGTLVGVCPDMCPEKERFLREYQRRLSRFEMLPGTEGVSLVWRHHHSVCSSILRLPLRLLPLPLPSPPPPPPLLQLATPSVDHSTAVKEYSKSAADQVRVGLAC